MSNTITFESTELTVHDHQGQPWLKAADIARALGYKEANAVTRLYSRNQDEFTGDMTQVVDLPPKSQFGTRGRIFSPRGTHLIAMLASTPLAKRFRQWVLDALEAPSTELPSDYDTTTARIQAINKRGKALALTGKTLREFVHKEATRLGLLSTEHLALSAPADPVTEFMEQFRASYTGPVPRDQVRDTLYEATGVYLTKYTFSRLCTRYGFKTEPKKLPNGQCTRHLYPRTRH